ncbi:MAG: phosphoenolpyruvate hydrolase family protein [Pseudomonadota bacterium]
MARIFERGEIVDRLKAEIDKGRAIFDAFAGTGISAKFAEAGGADMITTHILARFRMAGLLGTDPTRDMERFLDEIIAAGFSGKKPQTLVTCHGGATVTPQDVQYLLDNTKGLDGYVGGSTAERLPVERSITRAVKEFKDTKIR